MLLLSELRIKFLRTFFMAVLLVCSSRAMGQTSIFFDHFTTNDGLSQSDVNAIYQDHLGFMWFGTHDGLNKYNGYEFTVYKPELNNPQSINSNLIFTITGDQDDNLWIGTTGSGLNYFDRSTETFAHYRNEKDNPKSLNSDHIIKVFIDSNERLWVATNKGINMADLTQSIDSLSFLRLNLENEMGVPEMGAKTARFIYEDTAGQIWVGGSNGLFKLARDKKGDYFLRCINDEIGLPSVSVETIVQDNLGRILIGTWNGLLVLENEGKKAKTTQIYNGPINDLQIDGDNNLWGGTNQGLIYFKTYGNGALPKFEGQFKYDPSNVGSISKNIVKSLFLDRTEVLWIGTNGGGVNKLDPLRKQFKHIRKTLNPSSLSYDKIRSIFEDSNGTLWIGTEGGGLNMLTQIKDSRNYLNFRHFNTLKKAFAIEEIHSQEEKTLFIGGEGSPSLSKIDITRPNHITEKDITLYPNFKEAVFALLEDHNNALWIGTYNGGLHKWVPDSSRKTFLKSEFVNNPKDSASLPDNIVRNILEDSKNNLWVATGNGLAMLPAKETQSNSPVFENFKNVKGDSTSLSHNYVLELYESKKGTLWIGTFGGGLNQFIPGKDGQNGSFIAYTESNGLPNNVIKGILEDDNGHLWLSTNQGLSKFDPVQKTFKNYDVNDGLQSNEFQELASLKRKDGELLFGGVNGFNAFFPEDIKDNSLPTETVITNFTVNNRPVRIDDGSNGGHILEKSLEKTEKIRLNYDENNFSFEFASLHFAAPLKNKFAYKLEGFDKDWIRPPLHNRFATYTNIPPGNYTLKVKASNNDGLWDETPEEINITVVPPFWETPLAYLIYGLLSFGLLVGFWRFTIISTTKKYQLEMEHLEKEKNEELQRIKLEFFTNISHEFRTPLTLIKAPLEYLRRNNGKIPEKAVQEQYELMQKNTNYLLRLVNQLLDFRKITQGKMRLVVRHTNIVSFIKEIAQPFEFLARKKSIAFTIDASDHFIRTWFDHDALEKIMNNLLSNAFKFTPENGVVRVEIFKEEYAQDAVNGETLVIKVIDTGRGIDKSKLKTIFKRFYIEKEDNAVNAEGIGIGLSFTKSLIKLHRGTIGVDSIIGTGTTFTVRLPIAEEAYRNIPEISRKEVFENDFLVRSSETESFAIGINDELEDLNLSQSRSKLPVLLIVDDNSDMLTFIKQALGKQYTIYDAEHGEKGLEIVNKVMPNLIITDLIMPIMNGIEFCKILKTTKTTSHIPVVMLTAKSSQESEIEGLKFGADAYMRKPFNVELLELKLANILRHREELRKRFNQEITLQPSEVTVTSLDEKFLQQAVEVVEKHMMNTDFNVEMLVREMGHSRSNLYLKLKELTGLSSSEFIRNIRLKRAIQFLEGSDYSVKEIMFRTGFNTASYFSKCFKKQFGVTPSEYVREKPKTDKIVDI